MDFNHKGMKIQKDLCLCAFVVKNDVVDDAAQAKGAAIRVVAFHKY